LNSRNPRGVKSWVLYWEPMPGHPLPIALDHEVVAILPPSWGEDRVKDVLERLYLERTSTLDELLMWRNRGSSPYPPECGASYHGIRVVGLEYYCGHNPILKARKVERLVAIGEEELSWMEIGMTHTPFLCEAAGEEDCPLIGKEPYSIRKHGKRAFRPWSQGNLAPLEQLGPGISRPATKPPGTQ
jgi:hypothetical protein